LSYNKKLLVKGVAEAISTRNPGYIPPC